MYEKIIRSTLLNIDSSFRSIYPKNICSSNGQVLPENPLTLTMGSQLIKINYPNHKLELGDNITIQNVEGITKIISNSIYLFTDFKYAVCLFDSNNININYGNYISDLFLYIDLIGEQIESNNINNIKLNDILGYKKCLISSDIPSTYLTNIITLYLSDFQKILNTSTTTIQTITTLLDKKCLFIELPLEYDGNNTYRLNQMFKISYSHIGGIPLGYLNANYPINDYNYQSNYEITNIIDSDNFSIIINLKSFDNIQGGGKNVIINKIINTIVGYPDADNYVINLKKSFNNVTKIELISTEFPYIDIVIKKNVNDKLYWKHIEDGTYIYNIVIEEGFYSSETFTKKLMEKMNNILRVNLNLTEKYYNSFDIITEPNIQKIIFKPYIISKLPNSLSVSVKEINNIEYYILTINHPNNYVEVDDFIIISESSSVAIISIDTKNGLTIPAKYINTTHKIYEVNLQNSTYNTILGKSSEIISLQDPDGLSGGVDIKIKTKTKISLLFDKPDTCGDILGFRDVGSKYSIIDFSSEISNYDSYINSINLNVVGNQITSKSNFMNFVGKYNYILMYLNDIEYIYSNNDLLSAFAKIQLSGNPGDILFNTFISSPHNIYFKGFPISTLSELTVKFTYPDGSRINFRNINHSFTLKITEEQTQSSDIYINSQKVSVMDELKRANLKN